MVEQHRPPKEAAFHNSTTTASFGRGSASGLLPLKWIVLKPTIFREYDIRGIADSELLSPDIELLGLGLGTYLQRKSGGRNISVGRDCRVSSPRLHQALVKGLLASGCDVTDIGVVPTPVLYYSAHYLKASGAIMITGSHNPPEYNGFKTVCGSG